MTAFAETSAIVKLYSDEAGHESVRSLRSLVVSQLTRVEVPSALWRKERMGELPARDVVLLLGEFEADYFGTIEVLPRFSVVLTSAEGLDDAARLVGLHGLRAFDAVQLASAKAAREVDPSCTVFASFDRRLVRAALAEGFDVIDEK